MKLWIATGNAHKVEEIKEIMGEDFELKSLLDIPDFPEIEENGQTYKENALIKAKTLWDIVKEPVFADDSGLEVDALNGEPGLRSARYSSPNPSHEKNIQKMLKELSGIPDNKRTACFRSQIVYIDLDGNTHDFEGIFPGTISKEKCGCGGFGYDPIFYLPDRKCSVAELPASEKNRISHRGIAVAKLKKFLIEK